MRIAVLAATGPTGRELTFTALRRGHDVVAVVRDPAKLEDLVAAHPALAVRRGDVLEAGTVAAAVGDADVVVSGLGIARGDRAGTLTAGAQALAAAGPRFVWLGALGAGTSAGRGGRLYDLLMRAVLRSELAEKARADEIALAAGATVVHAGPLAGGAQTGRLVELDAARRGLLGGRTSRRAVAHAILDEAESPQFAGRVAAVLTTG